MPTNPQEIKGQWCPAKCPVTMRPFFMWIEHPEKGIVPTYGGPFDSYTIPEPEEVLGQVPFHEVELTCERYDHDEGAWVETEDPGLRIIDEQVLINSSIYEDE